MSKGKITKVHSFTKYLFQCLLVLIEFGGVSAAFVYITSLIVPCTTVIDCLERGTLGLALYEFLIFVILEAINDGRKDSLIALQSAYCQAILACEEDSFTEVVEISHTVRYSFQDLGFIVAAFNVPICPRDIHGIQDLLKPVMAGGCAVVEFWHIHQFHREKPVGKPLLAFSRGL